MLDAVLQHLTDDSPHALDRLRQLLSIPSVSTDPAYAADVARAAQWVADTLRDCGLDVAVHRTPGHPIVVGRSPGHALNADQPRVLFYGHYDVQPPDPIELWTTPPFEPTVRHGAVFARGASDDKGQIACFFEALRAWKRVHGRLPVPVTVLIEGEEECGSIQLQPFVRANRDALRADIAVVSDTGMWEAPDGRSVAITYGLRGLLYFDVQLHHADRDVHSGVYGGVAANPATALATILGRLFDDRCRVTIPGFYDDVLPISPDERRRWNELGFDEELFLRSVGFTQPFGESDYSTLERRWARPSCDVNGLYGGYGGPGAKTIIPSFAGAKVSFRLAPNQSPAKIAEAFKRWLHAQDVHGCRWKITELGGADPVVVSTDSPFVAAATRAIQRTSGRPPVLIREGATIPIVTDFKKTLGVDSLLIGFGLSDDCIHAPNEKFNLDCFTLGCRTHAALLQELAAPASH
jgi:acetylornithine deacetylase/succinyl-diaminopimelate desuccinylase-like protein